MTDVARVALEADSSGLRKAKSELKGFGREAKGTQSKVSNLARTIKTLGASLAIGAAFRQIIRNTAEQERVTAQLNQTLRSTGRFTEELSSGLQDYASALQEVTTFGDEAIIGAQSLLLTFTQIGEEAFPRAQEAVLDVATAMGTDLKSAAVQVGKALNDPVLGLTALQRSGIQFNDAQKETIKGMVEMGNAAGAQAIILDELETQFGGSARAARNTLGGAIQSLKNAFGDLLEGDGGGAGLTGATKGINDLADVMNDPSVATGFSTLVEGTLTFIGTIARATAETVKFAEFLGVAFARAVVGPDTVIGQLDEQIQDLESSLEQAESRLEVASNFKPLFAGADTGVEELRSKVEEYRSQLDQLRQQREEFIKMENQPRPTSETPGIGDVVVPRLGGTGDDPGPLGDNEDLTDKLEARREALLQGLESERHTILREFGERNEEINELEEAGFLTQMQADNARIQSEAEKQQQLTELTKQGEEERLRVQERSAQMGAQVQQQINSQMVNTLGNAIGTMRSFAEEGSAAWVAFTLAQKGIMATQAIMSANLAATLALTSFVPGDPTGPARAVAQAEVLRGLGFANAALILAQGVGEIAASRSFDGGGFTGPGARSGGVDGKGGFPAILHPNETVIDHTRGQSVSNSNCVDQTLVFQISGDVTERTRTEIMRAMPLIREQAKQAVIGASSQGGSMSRAMGRRP